MRFRHNDHEHLDELLRASDPGSPRLIAMDGVNSMTGNAPDIAEFSRIAGDHGALLYVDDAHGFGVIGERSPDELCGYGTKGNGIMRHLDVPYDNTVFVAGLLEVLLVAAGVRRAARPGSRTPSRCWRRPTSTRDRRRSRRSRRRSPGSR